MSDNSSEITVAKERLDRLEGFLREDPNNLTLMEDAFAMALRAKEWQHAEFYLRQAQKISEEKFSWALKEGDFWLAQKDWGQAEAVLEPFLYVADAPRQFLEAVAYDLAYIEFQRSDYQACVNRLASWLEHDQDNEPTHPFLQRLWLRSLHRTGELERAYEWAAKSDEQSALETQSAGIASLIALDLAHLESASRWSDMALSHRRPGDDPMEALVTRSSIALAERNAIGARNLASEALAINPDDGRAWSALAFSDLLAGDLMVAREHFVRSLELMPQHIGTWHGLGWTQILLKDLAGARATFEKAIELNRNFGESHGGLAVVQALSGQTYQAQESVERALRLDKNGLSGRYAQAILTGEVKDVKAVQRFAHRILGNREAPMGGYMSDWLPKSSD